MRSIFVLFTFLVACGTQIVVEEDFDSIQQEYNGTFPPPVACEFPKISCRSTCVDISRDMKNCGGCGEECNISEGEFCLSYYCRNVRNFGFTLEPNGPRQYDIRRDLPRPVPINAE